MNTRTDNTQNTADEFRQAAKRLGDGAAHVAKAIPWMPILKGTGKLAINILRYSMGIAIYGLIVWPYRIFAGIVGAGAPDGDQYDKGDGGDWENEPYDATAGQIPGVWEFDDRSVNGNIHISIGDGSFHMTDHDRLDTV